MDFPFENPAGYKKRQFFDGTEKEKREKKKEGKRKKKREKEKMRRPKNLENIRKWLILVSAPVVFLTVFGVFVALSSVPAASAVYLRRASQPWEGWRSRRMKAKNTILHRNFTLFTRKRA